MEAYRPARQGDSFLVRAGFRPVEFKVTESARAHSYFLSKQVQKTCSQFAFLISLGSLFLVFYSAAAM